MESRTPAEIRELAAMWRARIEKDFGFGSGGLLHKVIKDLGGEVYSTEATFFPTGALIKSPRSWRIITRPYHMYAADNFYLAFGLGEYALHEDLPYYFTEFEPKAPYHDASIFAHNLLMPTDEFKAEWGAKGIKCAVHFSVEKRIANYRAISLRLIEEE